jgi:excisionase family DNA binding protein
VAEAADRLGVSKETVRRWCQTGKLPAKRVGFWWRIRPEDVEQLIAQSLATQMAARAQETIPV